MIRKTKEKMLVLFLLLTFITFSLQSAMAVEKEYLTRKNGVTLTNVQQEDSEGSLLLEGETIHNKIKVKLEKDGYSNWYDIHVKDGYFREKLWLTKEIGTYEVTIMVHEYDRKYSRGPEISIESNKRINPFLVPGKHIESHHHEIVNLAQEITNGKTTDMEKALAIYEWMIEEIHYDYKKLQSHRIGKYDNTYGALNTLRTKNGVCYDYASLVTALGRALGLETKLITGMVKSDFIEGLHAWNEIYVLDQEVWVVLDTTLGATTNENYFDIKNLSEIYNKIDEY